MRDGFTGAAFNVDAAAGLAAALHAVRGDSGLRMGAAARLMVQAAFDIDTVATRYEALYAELMDRKRR